MGLTQRHQGTKKNSLESKVVTMAKVLGVKGFVKNLSDGRVMVVAEGERSDLERLYKALWIKNAIIHVSAIEEHYGEATGIFDDFDKIVGDNETDSRLDTVWKKQLLIFLIFTLTNGLMLL